MHTIKLDVKSITSSGGAHASLIIDGQDTGILYLSESEYELLVDTLRTGALESENVLFEHVSPDDEIEFDEFDD